MQTPVLGLPLWMVLFAAALLSLLVAMSARARPLRPGRLWMGPALVLGATLLAIAPEGPPRPLLVAIYALSLAVGAALGWWIASHTQIRAGAAGTLISQLSPFGLMAVLALVAARIGLREVLAENAAALQVSTTEVADAFLLMAVGLVSARGVEMWLRGRRLLRRAA
ncbi:hypothetical protein [Phenylobacterium sp.]|uniref:hypothetical protein n=1 Tax=Phenylobacterium sp. TaxID=1871053 RepID=UPI0035B2BEAA